MNCTFECTNDLEEGVQGLGTYLGESRDDDFSFHIGVSHCTHKNG